MRISREVGKISLWLLMAITLVFTVQCTAAPIAAPSAAPAAESATATAPAEEASEVAALRPVRFTHGGSLCNIALFVAFEHPEWWAEFGLVPESVPSANISDQIAALNSGVVDMAGSPYTSALASIAQSDDTLRIISGIGEGGLGLLAQAGLETAEDFRGTTWAISPSDTLEVLAAEYLARIGLVYPDDIEPIYIAGSYDPFAAFAAGQVDVTVSVEPYTTELQRDNNATLLTDGRDIFGESYSDCVLSTSTKLLQEEPNVVIGTITALMRGQQMVEQDTEQAIDLTIDKWFKVRNRDDVYTALAVVNPMIDQRNQMDFIMNCVDFMVNLGYISENLRPTGPEAVFDWSAMEQVIADNPEMHASLVRKSE